MWLWTRQWHKCGLGNIGPIWSIFLLWRCDLLFYLYILFLRDAPNCLIIEEVPLNFFCTLYYLKELEILTQRREVALMDWIKILTERFMFLICDIKHDYICWRKYFAQCWVLTWSILPVLCTAWFKRSNVGLTFFEHKFFRGLIMFSLYQVLSWWKAQEWFLGFSGKCKYAKFENVPIQRFYRKVESPKYILVTGHTFVHVISSLPLRGNLMGVRDYAVNKQPVFIMVL